jgi:putative ATPase
MDLFTHAHEQRLLNEAPLAARMRPRTLEEFVGQEVTLSPAKLLRRAVLVDRLFISIILWGSSDSSMTSLVIVIANLTKSLRMSFKHIMWPGRDNDPLHPLLVGFG